MLVGQTFHPPRVGVPFQQGLAIKDLISVSNITVLTLWFLQHYLSLQKPECSKWEFRHHVPVDRRYQRYQCPELDPQKHRDHRREQDNEFRRRTRGLLQTMIHQ